MMSFKFISYSYISIPVGMFLSAFQDMKLSYYINTVTFVINNIVFIHQKQSIDQKCRDLISLLHVLRYVGHLMMELVEYGMQDIHSAIHGYICLDHQILRLVRSLFLVLTIGQTLIWILSEFNCQG